MTSVAFAANGDTLTGDSEGDILVWGTSTGSQEIVHAISKAHEVCVCVCVSRVLCANLTVVDWQGNILDVISTSNGFLSGGHDSILKGWTADYKVHHVDSIGHASMHITMLS